MMIYSIVALSIAFFLYSFTQVDLNLTLTDQSNLAQIQQSFQYIGYFQRPLSTYMYIGIVSLSAVLYGFILYRRPALLKKKNRTLLGLSVMILLFSYPAFSYDLFNYLFDARIVTLYGDNPYLHRALDYPEDPWTSFMRWTHRTYPYGPTWLALSVPLSFFGMQKFVITLYLFKTLMLGAYLAAARAIYLILKKVSPDHALFGVLLFTFNPLIVVETLVSAHHDMTMMALALWSVYFLMKKNHVASLVLLILSIGVKFATLFLIPAFLYVWWRQYSKKKISWRILFFSMTILMIGAVIAASIRTQFQPWYLIFAFPFATLIPDQQLMRSFLFFMSLTGLALYIPFLYTGNWDPPIPQILNLILVAGTLIVGVGIGIPGLFGRTLKK